ncbi:MAG TPA: 4-hydroxy-tetrahydrodipicolinate reductase [Acidimicrobiales bacterium]|nr:4-hydroxy-tetrahydrodipicolinate reductase [Acidimicrobiales bacterium]
MAVRVGVFGAGGRMGATVCQAVAADPELELVAAVDPHYAGLDLHQVTGVSVGGLQVAPDPAEMARAGAEVAVDFTHLEAAMANLRWCASTGVHAVVGTSGFAPDHLAELERLFGAEGPNCIVAPNFAVGAVLMMRFAEIAAPFFETGEIIELHHDAKIDAPSGTAVATAQRMDSARQAAGVGGWSPDPTTTHTIAHARGAEGAGHTPVHSVRMRGLMAHQEVILGTTGQTLTLRHDTSDRTSFMPGVLIATKAVAGRPGLTVGLDAVLGIL